MYTLSCVLFGFLSLLLLAVDFFSKIYIYENFRSVVTTPIIEGILHITYCENTGGPFSIFRGQVMVLGILSIFVMIGIAAWLVVKKPKPILYRVCGCLFLAGGLGNLIDRLWRGYVVDFIHISAIDFPIFNIADIYVTVAACLFLFQAARETILESKAGDKNEVSDK